MERGKSGVREEEEESGSRPLFSPCFPATTVCLVDAFADPSLASLSKSRASLTTVQNAWDYHCGWLKFLRQVQRPLYMRVGTRFSWTGSRTLENFSIEPADQTSHALHFEAVMSAWCLVAFLMKAAYYNAPLTNFLRKEACAMYITDPDVYEFAEKTWLLARCVLSHCLDHYLRPLVLNTGFVRFLPELDLAVAQSVIRFCTACASKCAFNAWELHHVDQMQNMTPPSHLDRDSLVHHFVVVKEGYRRAATAAHELGNCVRYLKLSSQTHASFFSTCVALRRSFASRAMMIAAVYLCSYATYQDVLCDRNSSWRDPGTTMFFLRWGVKAAHIALLLSCRSVDVQTVVRVPDNKKILEEVVGEHHNNHIPNFLSVVERSLAYSNIFSTDASKQGGSMSFKVITQHLVDNWMAVTHLCNTPLEARPSSERAALSDVRCFFESCI